MGYGFSKKEDNVNEKYIYKAGKDGHMPLILFAMYLHKKEQGIERFFNLKVHTEDAKEITQKWLKIQNKELKKECENIIKGFDGFGQEIQKLPKKLEPVSEDFFKPKGNIEEMLKSPDNSVLPFYIYNSQLYTFLSMKTANFNGGSEGSPQTCPLSYIKFWGKEEFKAAHNAIDAGFNHVITEIIRGFKEKNPAVEINESDLTIKVQNYKAISFEKDMYPGF